MLHNYFNNLQQSIQWAQQQDDIDVLCMARDSMNHLLDFVDTLPLIEQLEAQQTIDQVLPMEWPLWMEACRYQDGRQSCQQATIH